MGTTQGAHQAPLIRFAMNVVPDSAELMLRKLRDMAARDSGRGDILAALKDLEGEEDAAVRLQTMQAAMNVTDPSGWPSDLRQAMADRLALQRDADTYNLYFRDAGTEFTVRDIPDIFQTADGSFGPDVTDVNNDGRITALDAAEQRLDGNLSDLAKRLDINKVTLGAEQDSAVLRPDEAHSSFDDWRDGISSTPLIDLGDGDDRLTFGTGVAVDPGEGTDFLTLRVEADTYEGGIGTQRSGSDYYIGANVDFSDPKDTIVIDFETAGDQYIHLVQVSETVDLEYGQATQVRLDVWVSDQRTLPAGTFESIYLGPASDSLVPVAQKVVGLNLGYSAVAAVDPYAASPLEGVDVGAIRQWQIGKDIFVDREVVGGVDGANVVNITV